MNDIINILVSGINRKFATIHDVRLEIIFNKFKDEGVSVSGDILVIVNDPWKRLVGVGTSFNFNEGDIVNEMLVADVLYRAYCDQKPTVSSIDLSKDIVTRVTVIKY